MENTGSQKNIKADWTQKGRGWIPDYPDLRDYQLDHKNIITDQRLRREGITGDVETLVRSLLDTFGKLGATQEQVKGLTEFHDQFSGGIYIAKLKIYKVLRQQLTDNESQLVVPVNENKEKTLDVNSLSSESLLFNQITELKNYLNFLVLSGYLQLLSDEDLKKDCFAKHKFPSSYHKLDNPSENAEWLGIKEFDSTTRQLVMLFQLYSGIHLDGIVGFQSYTTLNEYFKSRAKLSGLKDRAKKYKVDENLSPNGNQVKIKLQSIPVSLPLEILTAFLKRLKQISAKRIWGEYNQVTKNESTQDSLKSCFSEGFHREEKQDLCSSDFSRNLEEIFENSYKNHSHRYFSGSNLEKINEKNFNKFFEEILNDNGFSEISSRNLYRIFHENFYTVEPIFSMVFKLLSPLANFKNLSFEEIVDRGLQQFSYLFRQTYSSEQPNLYSANSSEVTSPPLGFEDNPEDLSLQAQQAVKKVIQLFYQSIKLILGDTTLQQDKEAFSRSLLFHLLLKKYLDALIVDFDQDDDELRNFDQPNLFDKQEFFVIHWMQQDTAGLPNNQNLQEYHKELFRGGELVVPVSDAFLDTMNLKKLGAAKKSGDPDLYFFLPGFVDLTFWCPKVRDQGSLNSCTAFAGTTLFEYFVNRSSDRYIELSALFLYKTTRQLMKMEGNGGGSVRETMKAMALFGIPPEEHWPYQADKMDEEPPSFCYAYANDYQALKYFRLDYAGISRDVLLFQIRAILTSGFPCMFGFTIYTSAFEESNIVKGHIPFPDTEKDRVVDGHAVVAVGYDDNKLITHANPEKVSTRGAILIRNSWGTDWGRQGYGWLPYDYVLNGLTSAWWSLLKADWFNGDNFGLGGKGGGGEVKDCTDQPGGCPSQPKKNE